MAEERGVFAEEFLSFLNAACTAYHAVEAAKERLKATGYVELYEANATEWSLARGGKYFFTRNSTTIIAFAVGGAYKSGNGFTVLGAHTDSPCFKIKPVTCFIKGDSLMLNTQPYGGGLWHTWFDRDLGVAGRVLVRNEVTGGLYSKLVRIDKAIARIPNLAIHLDRSDTFKPDLQEHAKAILSMSPGLVGLKPSPEEGEAVGSRLHPVLLHLVAKAVGIDPLSIEDMELQLIDVQPSSLGGADDELIFSGRLDNLCSTYQCLRAQIDIDAALPSLPTIAMCMLFDHEECGSSSSQGAGSSMFMDTIRIVTHLLDDSPKVHGYNQGLLMQTLRNSFLCSVGEWGAVMVAALAPPAQPTIQKTNSI